MTLDTSLTTLRAMLSEKTAQRTRQDLSAAVGAGAGATCSSTAWATPNRRPTDGNGLSRTAPSPAKQRAWASESATPSVEDVGGAVSSTALPLKELVLGDRSNTPLRMETKKLPLTVSSGSWRSQRGEISPVAEVIQAQPATEETWHLGGEPALEEVGTVDMHQCDALPFAIWAACPVGHPAAHVAACECTDTRSNWHHRKCRAIGPYDFMFFVAIAGRTHLIHVMICTELGRGRKSAAIAMVTDIDAAASAPRAAGAPHRDGGGTTTHLIVRRPGSSGIVSSCSSSSDSDNTAGTHEPQPRQIPRQIPGAIRRCCAGEADCRTTHRRPSPPRTLSAARQNAPHYTDQVVAHRSHKASRRHRWLQCA